MVNQIKKACCLIFSLGAPNFEKQTIGLLHEYSNKAMSFDDIKRSFLDTHAHLMANGAERPEKIEYLKSRVVLLTHIALEIAEGIQSSCEDFTEEFDQIFSMICPENSAQLIKAIDNFVESQRDKELNPFLLACARDNCLKTLKTPTHHCI